MSTRIIRLRKRNESGSDARKVTQINVNKLIEEWTSGIGEIDVRNRTSQSEPLVTFADLDHPSRSHGLEGAQQLYACLDRHNAKMQPAASSTITCSDVP